MLKQTITHYAPWTDADDRAYCGVYVPDARQHSATPSCPTCVAKLAEECALDDAIDTFVWPLDDAEVREFDPVLNAGVPFSATAFVADLFEYAVALSRQGGRR